MKTITTVRWTCPPDNVFKLNTDGSLPNSGGIACGGGLIRDSNGRWIKGFKAVFGKTSILVAELWYILEGMKLAKSLRLKDIIVESGNLIAVQILKGVLQPAGAVLSVVSAIQFILTPDWKVTFSHVLHDVNYVADWLAGHLHTHDFGVEVLDTPPADLVPWLMHDLEEEEETDDGKEKRGGRNLTSINEDLERRAGPRRQGKKEHITEVKTIGQLRHRNLAQLLGWCHDKGEFLLVYEFMPNGSLVVHLFGKRTPLKWPVRYKISLGLASALLYLHEEWDQRVVHPDVKSSNAMLDSNFNAKLGDFGLARFTDHEIGP
ncbi:hypothetical protein GH714_016657 [Hevea brasiliensis]|uniref:Protein kinase domain-containing protein n=1 Tax=Hevea brasiliensis TaxID=3981 RepID=A0A6A6K709_HEVBR|nr:hypothetical protein GH714_016657 [Hevea brasiliensis]